MRVNKWATARGAKIELHWKHVTEDNSTTDWGDTLTKKTDWIFIEKVVVNGSAYAGMIKRATVNDMRCLDLGNRTVNGQKMQMCVPLPADVEREVWGAYDERQKAKKTARLEKEKLEDKELAKMIANGYCTKCESYCHGDCQAN
jgi:hypothetical protein